MVANQYGMMAQRYWREIPAHFPHVVLDQFVVMPNHVHGIIIIAGEKMMQSRGDDNSSDNFGRDEAQGRDEALPRLYSPRTPKRISPKSGSISVIVGSFKSKCTKEIHYVNGDDFAWQQRYYDHIVRNEESLNRIRQYIIDNPLRWQVDRYHPDNAPETSTSAGNHGERIARWFLRTKGYRVLTTNFRVRGGEIDLVCRQGGTLVFVEVKTRTNRLGGYPEEAVTRRKMSRLQTAIEAYLQQHGAQIPIRIDVVSIAFDGKAWPEISHFQNVTPEDLTR